MDEDPENRSDAKFLVRRASWKSDRALLARVRFDVFVDEQQIDAALELDDLDDRCEHVVAQSDSTPIGTARLTPDGHVGRVAVAKSWRRHGVGRALVEKIIEIARTLGHSQLDLDAQITALAFYERLGFEATSDEFMEAGLPHRSMRRML